MDGRKCPPDYNGGFCADYIVDCDACWEQWEQEHKAMDECKSCANADNEYCFVCDNGNQFKPMTNADRIRAMTDEELSFFLDTATVCVCFPCTRDINNLEHFNNCKHENGTCEMEWLEWLKKKEGEI